MNVVMVLLQSDPVAPVVIWTVLLLLAALALVVLFDPHVMSRPLSTIVAGIGRPHRAVLYRQNEAIDAVRYADEIQTAYQQACHGAQRWHRLWQRTDQETGTAWQAWQDADQQTARLRAAAAFTRPTHTGTPAEYADRERYLHRAVHAAISRGDLPATAAADLTAGYGWDPRQQPADQQLALWHAITAHRRHLFTLATAAERTAWHDTLLAATARDSLRHAATTAELDATASRRHLPRRQRHTTLMTTRSLAPRLA